MSKRTGKVIINTKKCNVKIKKYPEFDDILSAVILIFSQCPKDHPRLKLMKTIFYNMSKLLGTNFKLTDVVNMEDFLDNQDNETSDSFIKNAKNYNNAVIEKYLENLNNKIIDINEKRFHLMSILEERNYNERL